MRAMIVGIKGASNELAIRAPIAMAKIKTNVSVTRHRQPGPLCIVI
jgi:hypothetical protein